MKFDRSGTADDRRGEQLERRLVRVLETRPSIYISEDFASRVASKAPARLASRGFVSASGSGSVGRRVAWVAAAVLLVAMLVLAPSAGLRANQWVEVGLAIEFAGLTSWLTLRPRLQL